MKNLLVISTTGEELLSNVDDNTNRLFINNTEIPSSDWVGTGSYSATVEGHTITIAKISELSGNIWLEGVSAYNYRLKTISSGGGGGSLPTGGTAGQLLTKNSSADGDASWHDKPTYSYNEISNPPSLGSAAAKNIPASGDASTTEVVMGDDSRLTNARNAADVYSWAKAASKPSYTASEVGALAADGKALTAGTADKVAHKLKMYMNTTEYDFDGSADKKLQFICLHNVGLPASYWSSTTDADGYYTATASILWHMDNNYTPKMWCAGAISSVEPTTAQITAYNLIGKVDINDDVLTFYAKTKPTIDIYFGIKGVKIE